MFVHSRSILILAAALTIALFPGSPARAQDAGPPAPDSSVDPDAATPVPPVDGGSVPPADGGSVPPADGGSMPPADGGSDCGAVTYQGECQGNVVVYCDDGVLTTIDCVDELSEDAVCMWLNPTFGVGCALPIGDECDYSEEFGDNVAPCQGTNAGCVLDDDSSTCTANLAACSDGDPPTCNGDYLTVTCLEFGQPLVLACDRLGGRCDRSACVEIPEDGTCDDQNLFCAPGLVCNGRATCEAQAADAGVPAQPDAAQLSDSAVIAAPDAALTRDAGAGSDSGADAGSSAGDSGPRSGAGIGTTPKKACGCSSARSPARSPIGLVSLAVLLLALGRRRRRA